MVDNTTKLTPDRQATVRYWIDTIGCDLVGCYSNTKDKFKEYWGNNLKENIDYYTRLETGFYDDGVAIICGRLRRGQYKGKYISVLDFDTLEAFLKFSANDFDYKKLAGITRLEWHGNLARMHVFFITDRPFKNAAGGGLEVKANKLLTFVSPSLHKDGKPYTAFGTEQIVILDNLGQTRIENRIAAIIPTYLSQDQINEYVKYLELDTTILHEGERHHAILVMANSYFFRYSEKWANMSDDYRFERLIQYDKKHCSPSLYETPSRREEFKRIWIDVCQKFASKREQERDARRKKQPAESEVEKKKKKVAEALEQVTATYHFATLEETDEILYYAYGVYNYGGGVVIRKFIENMFGEEASINLCREVLDHVRRLTYHKRSEFDANLNIINLKNGLYYVLEDKLEPHTYDYLSLRQKPIMYNPKAKIPSKTIQFLKQVVYPSDVWTLIELMAYTFYRDNPFEIITILHGSGSNGKSVLFGLLTALHGVHNVSNVSLKTIAERPFGLYDLVDKDCNLDAELSSGVIQDTAIIKKITGRQVTRVEQKWKPAFDVKLHAKLWLSANKVPKTIDESDAWYRRNVIIGFPNIFEEGKNADRDLITKLTTSDDLSGMFNMLMFALRRILEENKIFLNDLTIQERRERYERASDPIMAFIGEAIAEESIVTNSITKAALYEAYGHFCDKYRLAKESPINFGKILKQKCSFMDDRESSGKRRTIWKGVALTEEYIKAVQGRQTTLYE